MWCTACRTTLPVWEKLPFAYVGEVFGTGIIGGMLSYPIAYLIMGNKAAALFTFVVPFLISTCGGTIIAIIVTIPMKRQEFWTVKYKDGRNCDEIFRGKSGGNL